MSVSLNDDNEVAALRARCYRGIVKAPLDALDFDHPFVLGQRRDISEQNVQRLVRIFERNGCLRLQEENVINAIVLDEDLPVLLSTGVSALTPEQLRQVAWARDAPALSTGKLTCISGLHRIEAAKRHLDENDKWWPVRLFSADIPKPHLTCIIESFLNEQKPSDGEIFRKIRLYHRQNDVEAENRWWACLDKSKLRDLRQLLKKQEIAAAFDDLVDFPGLWARVQLGALQRLLALKCDEEIIAYLHHIRRAWHGILQAGSTTLPPSTVDAATVEKLESLAPSSSEIDRELVSVLMRDGHLFSTQRNVDIRRELENNICGFPGLIPSLRTFFETLKYLEPICEILRKLLGGKVRRTIRASLLGNHFAPEKTVVQSSATRDVELTVPLSKEDATRISYIELWLFCARHFDDLTTFTPRMEHKGEKPLVRGPNPAFWQCFAKFAMSRGFKTPRAKELSEGSCASELALDYLRKANPLSSDFDAALVEKVVNAGRLHTGADAETIEPDTSFIAVERRCGRPYELDLAKDKRALFFRHLYIESEPNVLSLSLVRRDLFSCIFGPFHFQPTDIGSLVKFSRGDAVEETMDIDEPFPPEFDDMLHLQYKELQQVHETQNEVLQQMSTAKSALKQQLAATRRDLEQLRSNHTAIQNEHARCVHLQAQNSALQTQISTLQAQKSEEQGRLEASLNSRDHDTQIRVQKIVELEHSKKELHDQIANLISACEGAADKTKAAEKREQSALAEVRYYKREAEDLQAQIDQQMLAIEEPTHQQTGDGSLAIPRNPIEVVNMMSDVTIHSRWMGSNLPYILFVAIANVENGVPKGFECVISKSAEEASETIASLLGAMDQRFSDVKAWDARGKAVLTSSTSYVFEVLSSGTVFLGPTAVFDTFLDSGANEVVLAPPRKIKQIKRVARTRPEGDKNYRAVVRYESNSENEMYESAADEISPSRQRKVPPPQLTIESTPDLITQSARIIEESMQTRPGDLSDSESNQSNESLSFRQRSARFK